MEQLNSTLRAARQIQQPLQPVQQAEATTYPQEGPRPIGNPTVLNPEIVAGSLRASSSLQRPKVPYNVQRPTKTPLNPLLGYRRYTWCITCGYRKSAHEPHERFGKPCRRTWCGKCYQRKECHANGIMGPLCQNEPHPTEGQHRFWYL
jgi:hypothetical protein